MKKRISALIIFALTLSVLFAFTACNEKDLWKDAIYTEDTALGEGDTEFILNVSAGGRMVTFTIRTDKAILGDALLELGLIEGEPGAYGLYVKRVNGIEADYEKDRHYWALWINDDYAPAGVDQTEISEGVHYTFERAK